MRKNVQVSDPIYEAMRNEAQRSGVDVNGLFEKAAEQLLAQRQIDELAAYGKSQALKLKRVPSDAVRFVREDRRRLQRDR